ncbi:TatD-like deoxyribonuclease [Oceanimonas sp. GK1]|uniref:TatD family hydrolase n=1 Tax=Oceanimonas sp. (strain GK1 / IBRC-M 10197) TaxID=511062 RepID=UPI0002494F3B|nr:TatD family hydrolase [Oceanimonas sp. GK1]AEY00764.1 TatD-like deoxyribonuclease [Oceanimonas sp. GK1]
MLLTDTHCHFDFTAFADDRAGHWQRAQAAGVHRLVIPGVEERQWPGLPALCDTLAGTRYALGLHPWWVEGASAQWQPRLVAALNAADERCVAIGETGLDMACKLPLAEQEDALVFQLKLACERGLPVIMHSHKAHDRLLKWLRRFTPVGGVVHGFAGSLQQAEAFWKLGIHLGIGGTITYERAQKTRNTVAAMPLEALVLETDAPDMPLCGFQGQPNHPERLPLVLQALAELRREPVAQLATALEANAGRLFAW